MNGYPIVRTQEQYDAHYQWCQRVGKPFLVVKSHRKVVVAIVDVSTAVRTFTDSETKQLKQLFLHHCRDAFWASGTTFWCELSLARAKKLLAKSAAVLAEDEHENVVAKAQP